MSTLGGKNLVLNFRSQEKFGPPGFVLSECDGWAIHRVRLIK
jgi:hypothetical protein